MWDHLLEFLLRGEECGIPCGSGKGWECRHAPGPAAPALGAAPGTLLLSKKLQGCGNALKFPELPMGCNHRHGLFIPGKRGGEGSRGWKCSRWGPAFRREVDVAQSGSGTPHDTGPWEYSLHTPKKATFPPIPVNPVSAPATNFGSTPTAFGSDRSLECPFLFCPVWPGPGTRASLPIFRPNSHSGSSEPLPRTPRSLCPPCPSPGTARARGSSGQAEL